ncbi:MAG: hypothetical protein HOF71_08095 [Chloroflexi bacterium]|jgi:hypothetical protein|nr:hypothetical protein [Chloroflexota bacterium]MBT5476128.1 hypothetical protein [Chloroflexota bacterium]
MRNNESSKKFDKPLDTVFSGASRFAIELVAWIVGSWAAADLTGSWLATIPALAILVALPGVFSTTGDKLHVVVAVPGRIRFAIEVLLAAIASALLAWTYIGAILIAIIAVVMFVTGAPRAKWLLSNSAPDWPLPTK